MRRLSPRSGRRDERGAVVILMAAFTVVIVGMAALVVDVGAIHDEKRQLQNGADAAALGLARYILGACPNAATPACTAALPGRASDLAKRNAHDSFTAVQTPVVDYSRKLVTVTTTTLDAGGGSILPFSFAQTLTGVKGKEVKATAAASWGGNRSAPVVRLTLSRCEWLAGTSNGTVFDQPRTILFHRDTPDNCPGGPSGANLPGGYGWLTDADSSPDDCVVTVPANATVGSDTGNSAPSPCHMADYMNQDVLMALFDAVGGSGSNGTYHIYGFAQFHLTAYRFPSGSRDGPNCGSNACLGGQFIRFVPIGDLGGPNLGDRVALVS